ncbi:glycoside hydrolase superfamily, partial [Mycena capillaripes]
AVVRAEKFVANVTLEEKINVTTGIDIGGPCVGNTGAGFQYSPPPLGVRLAPFVSPFPAAINAAATWDTALIEARGKAMGTEFRGKSVNVALGPMTNMGRQAAAGRNREGFGADPFLSGVATAATTNQCQLCRCRADSRSWRCFFPSPETLPSQPGLEIWLAVCR